MQFAQVIYGSYIAEEKMVGFKLVLYSLDGLTFQSVPLNIHDLQGQFKCSSAK